jgi:UDPglucose 6-dehydrogenase
MYHIVQFGLGTVGFSYSKAFKSKGMIVTGIEYNKDLVEKYDDDFDMYHTTDDLSNIANVNFILLSVCTPLNKETNELDMSYLFSTINNVATILNKSPNAYVVIRSTVVPFMTKKYEKELQEKTGNKVNIAFVPEFLRAKSAIEDAINPWYCVLSVGDNVNVDPLIRLYSNFISVERISILSIEEAELLKIFHNSFNACKISFFNQAYLLCEEINKKHNTSIDMQKISNILPFTCEGLINRKYGTFAGRAYRGVCLPKDSSELSKIEGEYNLKSKLFKSIVDVNDEMIEYDTIKNIPEITDGDFFISYDKLKI